MGVNPVKSTWVKLLALECLGFLGSWIEQAEFMVDDLSQ